MTDRIKPAARQILLIVFATIIAFVVLVRTSVVSRFAYLVEKGRIEAAREAMPSSDEMNRWNEQARLVAEAVAPAVVQIETYSHRTPSEIESLRKLFQLDNTNSNAESNGMSLPDNNPHRDLLNTNGLRLRSGYGSGFIVDDADGRIVTNNHVIDEADEIIVYLPDGRRFDAELLGADSKTDLAVIRIEADRLHALPIIDSGSVEVGDEVMAVGNPFRLDGTFSRGIISAKGRSHIAIPGVEYQGFLQTDAVINPGNSGGPLVNMRGEVVAVNTAIATNTGHYDGVGFAIPSQRVLRLLPVLSEGGTAVRGYLGVSIVSVEDSEALAKALDWPNYHGVIVRDLLPDTPAGRAGLKVSDIVLKIDDAKLRSTADLIDIIGETAPGETVELTVWREGEEITLPVEVGRQPENFSTRMRLPRREEE